MNEIFVGSIEKLERAVRRWQLIAFVLGGLFLCSVACGGTFTTLLLLAQPDRRAQQAELQMLMAQEAAARAEAEAAQQRAEQALRAAKQP